MHGSRGAGGSRGGGGNCNKLPVKQAVEIPQVLAIIYNNVTTYSNKLQKKLIIINEWDQGWELGGGVHPNIINVPVHNK